MADLARTHPNFKCGAMRYEVTPTDSLDGRVAHPAEGGVGARLVKRTTPGGKQTFKVVGCTSAHDSAVQARRFPPQYSDNHHGTRVAHSCQGHASWEISPSQSNNFACPKG